jgi:ORF6N domain-containing protein
MSALVPRERIEKTILVIRGHKVMVDGDLAELYSASTKVLNKAVKRNNDRFPKDFIFRLTKQEELEVVTNCDHLRKLKFSPAQPFAFTEHGAVMVTSVLNSRRAVGELKRGHSEFFEARFSAWHGAGCANHFNSAGAPTSVSHDTCAP